MLPLLHPCDSELLRQYLWPPTGAFTTTPATGHHSTSRSGSRKSTPETAAAMPPPPGDGARWGGRQQECYGASCVDLLPDDPTTRGMHTTDTYFVQKSTDASPEKATQQPSSRLNHSYALVTSDQFEESTGVSFSNMTPLDGKAQSSACTGWYILQFIHADTMPMNETLGSDLFAGEGRGSLPPGAGGAPSDQDLMMHVLAARKEGVLGGPKNATVARSSPAGNELSILSTVCRWRSCLAESCKESGSKYLCRHHFNVKHFLDHASKTKDKGGPKESAKFLPKKATTVATTNDDGDRDLHVIRGASTLIQELWDGKLKATVSSFTQKTCVDIEVRKRLEMAVKYLSRHMSAGSGGKVHVRVRPQWSRWRAAGEIERCVEKKHTTS